MGIETIVASILAILAVVIPAIVGALVKKKQEQTHETEALIQRDLDVLHGPPTGGVQPPKLL